MDLPCPMFFNASVEHNHLKLTMCLKNKLIEIHIFITTYLEGRGLRDKSVSGA